MFTLCLMSPERDLICFSRVPSCSTGKDSAIVILYSRSVRLHHVYTPYSHTVDNASGLQRVISFRAQSSVYHIVT